MKSVLKVLLAVMVSINLYADSIDFGLGSLKFDYNEYLDNGSWYNSEVSNNYELDGAFIKYNYDLGKLQEDEFSYNQNIELWYSFHLNKAYHKQPNTVDTKTKNYLHQTHIRYKVENQFDNKSAGIFVGLGYRYWDRDMLGGNGISGYLETYQWPYYEAGLAWKWYDGNY